MCERRHGASLARHILPRCRGGLAVTCLDKRGYYSLLEIRLLTSCMGANPCLKDVTCLAALLRYFNFTLEHLAEDLITYLALAGCSRMHFWWAEGKVILLPKMFGCHRGQRCPLLWHAEV